MEFDLLLPDLEEVVLWDCERLADVILQNVPADESSFWAEVGVRVGHA